MHERSISHQALLVSNTHIYIYTHTYPYAWSYMNYIVQYAVLTNIFHSSKLWWLQNVVLPFCFLSNIYNNHYQKAWLIFLDTCPIWFANIYIYICQNVVNLQMWFSILENLFFEILVKKGLYRRKFYTRDFISEYCVN